MLIWFFLSFISQVHAKDFESHYASICQTEDCPAFVGTLAFIDPADKGTHICSATLVASDEILTNLHCVPSDIRHAGASCAESMQFLLPGTLGLEPEQIPCAKIDRISDTTPFGDNQDVPDWALIKLQRPARRELAPVAQVPLEFGTRLHAYTSLSVDVGFSPIVEIQKIECEVTELGYLQPLTFHPTAPMFALKKCTAPIVPGNSGSAFLDESGHFVGLLSLSTLQRYQDLASLREDGSPIAAGTKLLCIPLIPGAALPPSCSLEHDETDFDAAATTFSVLRAFAREPQALVKNSGLIRVTAGSPEERVRTFEAFYPDAGYAKARSYFQEQKMDQVVTDLDHLASQILPEVPSCVSANASRENLELNMFTYRDVDTQPGSDGELYLNTAIDMSLITRAKPVRVSVEIQGPTLRFRGDPSAWGPRDERNYADCLKATASPECKAVYNKKAFALYLKPFTLELPFCSDSSTVSNK